MSAECVRIMCPNLNCRKVLAVPTSARGKTVRCRNCATNIRVPATAAAIPAASAPTPAQGQGAAGNASTPAKS